MQYIVTFLEGIISFISPCMLPLLPVYVSYFAGNAGKTNKVLLRALAFVTGFTVVFCLLGVFAGTLGAALVRYQVAVNFICGLVVVLFGLSYLGIIRIKFFKGFHSVAEIKGIFSAFVFGVVFSISHTPCVGAFLGSALMMASGSGNVLKGVMLLLAYSLGVGIPFVASAVLVDKLTSVFESIKKHYEIINKVCGIFLIVVGVIMTFGVMDKITSVIGM